MYFIIGGDSLIGQALAENWTQNGLSFHFSTRQRELVSTNRPFLDLEYIESSQIDYHQYDAAVFCAAMSKLSDCETNPEKSRKINVLATSRIIHSLTQSGVFVLFLSSSQVFDGTQPFRRPTEKPCPVNQYGKQKAEAEDEILKIPNTAILRMAKVIHPNLPLFQKWKHKLIAGESIYSYKNYYFSPVELNKVVKTINLIIEKKQPGIHHTLSGEDVSYYDYAINLGKLLGVDLSLIEGVEAKLNFNSCKYTSLAE